MSSAYRPEGDIPDTEFEGVIFPGGREPGSLTDLQYIYGKMLELGQEPTPYAASEEYQQFLTPMEVNSIIGEEQAIIYLDVQLNREQRSVTPIGTSVVTGTKEHIDRCAFSEYEASNGVDHSITQKTSKEGGIDPDKSTYKDFSYISENKFSDITDGWPTQDLIQPVIDDHEDGWIIEQIKSLHESEEMDELRDEIETKLTVDDSKDVTRLVSIRFYESSEAVSADELSPPADPADDRWLYPADMDVLLEAMKAQRKGKWRTKNDCDASGTAVGYVQSGAEQQVFGQGAAPLSLYTGKKRAWMPHLNRDLSAATHPFTAETSAVIGKSTPFLDACKQSAGLSLYHLPYFGGEQTPQKMRYLYELLWETYTRSDPDEDDEGVTHTPIEQFYRLIQEEVDSDRVPESIVKSLRFWTVAIVNYQSDRNRAIAEVKGGSMLATVDIAQEATGVARDLSETGLFETYTWDFATPETDFLAQITTPYWFINTTVTTTDEDDVDQNEPGYAFYKQLLQQKPISLSQLLDAYIPHLEDRYDPTADDGRRVPTLQIIQQFAQLVTLGRSGLLDVDLPETPDTDEPYCIPAQKNRSDTDPTDTDPMTDADDSGDQDEDGSTDVTAKQRAIAEKEAYERMITEQPVLAESPSRRAVFTLGSLITTVSAYQSAKGTKPLNSRLSPSTITKHNVEEYVTDVLDLINTYATAENGDNIWKYETQTSQLTEDLTTMPVSEWELSSSDIQYHVALGMAFGAQTHT